MSDPVRRGTYLRAARDLEAAVGALLDGAVELIRDGLYFEALECSRTLDEVIQALALPADDQRRCQAAYLLSRAQHMTGASGDCLRTCERALENWPTDRSLRGSQGNALRAMNRLTEAAEVFRAMIDEGPAGPADPDHRTALAGLGACLAMLGRHEEALPWARKARALAGARHLQAQGDVQVAWSLSETGRLEEAAASLLHALEALGEDGPPRARANAMQSLGSVLRSLGERERAREYFERSLPLYHLATGGGVAYSMINLGQLALEDGALAQAREYLERGAQQGEHQGRPHVTAIAVAGLLEAAVNVSDPEWDRTLERMRELPPASTVHRHVVHTLRLAADAARRANRLARAEAVMALLARPDPSSSRNQEA